MNSFKQLYLLSAVIMLGLKVLAMLMTLLWVLSHEEPDLASELSILIPTLAGSLAIREVARHGTLYPRHRWMWAALIMTALALGSLIAVVENSGVTALSPRDVLGPALLLLVLAVSGWLFGGVVLGVVFMRRPGLDEDVDLAAQRSPP